MFHVVHKFRAGFSLIEVMVVLIIMAMLCLLLFPVLSKTRESARLTQCNSHFKQWGQAGQLYLNDHNQYLPHEGQSSNPALAEAWYNQLPPLLDVEPYKDIYDGASVGKHGGYDNDWVWYCPTKILYEEKNSGSGKNAFHYGMNAVLNGSNKYTPDYGKGSEGQKFTSLRRIQDLSVTVFMAEGKNQPAISPSNQLDRERHLDKSLNLLFLDMHVKLIKGRNVPEPEFYGGPRGVWLSPNPRIVWGPFKNH